MIDQCFLNGNSWSLYLREGLHMIISEVKEQAKFISKSLCWMVYIKRFWNKVKVIPDCLNIQFWNGFHSMCLFMYLLAYLVHNNNRARLNRT